MSDISQVQAFTTRVIENVEKVIVGKRSAVEFSVIGLLSRGHLLIEDVPGVGKTMLARSLSCSIGGSFGRIQFTPDMLPSDVTGVSIFNQASREFEFRPGPLMAQVVLVDEIKSAGHHQVNWNGLDDSGRQVASGVYLYTLVSGSLRETKKLLRIK